jgi:hypothetical protein
MLLLPFALVFVAAKIARAKDCDFSSNDGQVELLISY